VLNWLKEYAKRNQTVKLHQVVDWKIIKHVNSETTPKEIVTILGLILGKEVKTHSTKWWFNGDLL